MIILENIEYNTENKGVATSIPHIPATLAPIVTEIVPTFQEDQ